MNYIKAILDLLVNFPELLELVQTIRKGIADAETERKVTDDIKTIKEAFSDQDADKLNKLFNSK